MRLIVRRLKFTIPFLVLLALGLSALIAQAPSDKPAPIQPGATPEEVGMVFLEASNKQDTDKFLSLMTTKAREAIRSTLGEEDGEYPPGESAFENPVMGTAVIKGDVAKVPATVTNKGEEAKVILLMRKDAGEWRVSGMGAPWPGGGEFFLDYEIVKEMTDGPVEEFQKPIKVTKERARQFTALVSIPPEELSASWKRSYSFKDMPASEILAGLAKELGTQLDPRGASEALAKKITLNLKDVSVVQAIDAVATQAGLTVRFPKCSDRTHEPFGRETDENKQPAEPQIDGPALRFTSGVRAIPAVHSGPFVITVAEVEERVPHGTGVLWIKAVAPAMHEGIPAHFSRGQDLIEVDRVDSPDGLVHYEPETGTSMATDSNQAHGVFTTEQSHELRRLLRSVEKISVVSGAVKLEIPEEVTAVRFDKIETERKTAGALEFELMTQNDGTQPQLKITASGNPTLDHGFEFMGYNKAGEPVGVRHKGKGSNCGDTWDFSLGIPKGAELASLEVKVITKTREYSFPFEFKDLPLKEYSQMPEKEIQLDFGGHPAPCSAKFVKFTDLEDSGAPRFEMEIVNHSNKPLKSLTSKIFYLDAAGTELGDSFGTTSGDFMDDDWQPVANAGQTVIREQLAFRMPEGTQAMRIEIEIVEFADGERWHKEWWP